MRLREISHDRWHPFFSDFTHLHHGKRVNVETMNEGHLGVRSQVRDLPLVGIMEADPEAGAGQWIEVLAGDSPETEATCRIPCPAHVVLAEEENGQAVALQIESAEGQVTMVRFEPSCEGMPPGFRVC